jgi:hypothetical protein
LKKTDSKPHSTTLLNPAKADTKPRRRALFIGKAGHPVVSLLFCSGAAGTSTEMSAERRPPPRCKTKGEMGR